LLDEVEGVGDVGLLGGDEFVAVLAGDAEGSDLWRVVIGLS